MDMLVFREGMFFFYLASEIDKQASRTSCFIHAFTKRCQNWISDPSQRHEKSALCMHLLYPSSTAVCSKSQ